MNESHTLGLAFLNAATFLLCGSFIAYVVILVVPYVWHRPAESGDAEDFQWHFFIPCLDEALVIDATVRRLTATFPTAEVWCIDDASEDATLAILDDLADEYPTVHVVARTFPDARQGKGAALNAAWEALSAWLPDEVDRTRIVVGVLDADGELDANCPTVIAGPEFFGRPNVGAVQIRVRVATDRLAGAQSAPRLRLFLVRLQDVEFSGVIAAMQLLRRHLGSVGMGGNGQFTRMSALDRIAQEYGSPWHGSLLEDFELGLHVLLTGSATAYCDDTWVRQEGLTSLRALVRQRSRWAQGSMQCLRYLMPILACADIEVGAALEISYFLFLPWIQLAGGALYATTGIVLAWYALTAPGGVSGWLGTGAWGLIPLFVLFGLGPLTVWGPLYRRSVDRGISRRTAWLIGLANWPYSYVHHLATWWAFIRVAQARHDWKKTARAARQVTALTHPALRLVLPGRLSLAATTSLSSTTDLGTGLAAVGFLDLAQPQSAAWRRHLRSTDAYTTAA